MKKTILLLLIAFFYAQYGTYAQGIHDQYFEKVPYIGAFGTNDWTKGWSNWTPQNSFYPPTTVNVSGNITSNTTWSPSSSPVIGKAAFTNTNVNDTFFHKVNFVGAFGTDDWTKDWTNWDPQNSIYPATNVDISGNITTNTSWGPKPSPVMNRASFSNTNVSDAFFEKVTHIGAFGTVDWTLGWTNWNPQTTTYATITDTITGEINTNLVLSASKTYLLKGFVYVKSGASITIPAGTVLRGDKSSKGTLIIEKGGKIYANGTTNNPVIFTSNQSASNRSYGDWGGLVICGKAQINVPGDSALIEGGPTSYYGGGATPDDNDNSGVLKYVRIEFAGIPLIPDKELNGLTMGGVGKGTEIDYIQVSYCGDDAFEWFGGTVHAKHLVSFRTWDDDFDSDFGWRGKVQFGVVLRDPSIADVSGSNGFESDNDGSGSTNTPITNPIFSNISFFGPKVTTTTTVNSNYKRGMHLRRNTKLSVYNSVISGYPTGLFIDGAATQANATANTLQIENCIMSGMSNFFASNFERSYFLNSSRNNDTLATNDALLITDPFNLTNPDFMPTSSNAVYKLNGFVYVKSGATLTIEPGTIIRGDKTTKGTLIIERGAKIIAKGTSTQPIIFTSNQATGSRTYGDWGGLVICGKAQINVPGDSALIEGGPTSYYGGGATPDDNDNSGVLKYVRIEFSGIPLIPDKELNGLTMGGVGKGTEIDYIQVSYCGDDAYEWFGGTVHAKHLVSFRTWDDDFDSDFGWRGKVQFGVVLRDPSIADVSGSNGFESDNDGSGSTNTPITNPIFSNISFFGPKVTTSTTVNSNYKRGMHLRRNTKLSVYNSVISGYPTGLFIDGAATQANATANTLQIENCIMSGMSNFFASNFERSYFLNSSRNNDTLATNDALLITDPFNLTNPDFMPITNKVYQLNGFVYVKSGATLTIEPGTIIRGDKTTKGTLIIEKGAKIMAEGNSTNPIIFTSNQATGSRTYGDWGGLVICGKAQINVPGDSALIEGGPTSYYGGGATPNDNDNSGILKYVRIEFAGIPLIPDKELNGLTMGGVGKGTEIDYIQVSYCGDDAYEWFGGTVNAKHLVSFRTWDDDFDSDFGWRGKVQFGVVLRDPSIADVSGSNGFESDNDGSGSTNTPLTNPVFSNMSLFGPKVTPSTTINSNYKRAMHLRRNTNLNVYNSIFAGYPTGLFIDGATTQANATSDSLRVSHTVLSGMGSYFVSNFERTYFTHADRKNDTVINNTDLNISDPFNLANPDFLPNSNSFLLERSIWYVNTSISDQPTGVSDVNIYPNPFNTTATIDFKLENSGNTFITVTDINGKIIKQYNLLNLSSGNHQVIFDGSRLTKGIYLVRISSTDENRVLKMMLQ